MIEAYRIRLSPGIKISAGGVWRLGLKCGEIKKHDWSRESSEGLPSNQNIELRTENEPSPATPKTAILPKLRPFADESAAHAGVRKFVWISVRESLRDGERGSSSDRYVESKLVHAGASHFIRTLSTWPLSPPLPPSSTRPPPSPPARPPTPTP